ncbi:NAD(P)-binding protein [Meredithblackwellia eburnea MCA 4105]
MLNCLKRTALQVQDSSPTLTNALRTTSTRNMSFKYAEQSLLISNIVLITGGGTGMGRGMALPLAMNGAKVYITGRRMEKLEKVAEESKDFEGKIIPLQGDVGDLAGINKLFEDIKSREEHLDVLINDPDQVQKFLLAAKWEDFGDQATTNVASQYFMSATFIPLLTKSSSPQIINNASAMGVNGGASGSLSYSASKAMCINMTKVSMPRLNPDAILTWLYPSGENTPDSYNDMNNSMYKPAIDMIPDGRCGFPENLAGVVLFLSSKASEYSNGLAMSLDGGWLLAESNAPCLPTREA